MLALVFSSVFCGLSLTTPTYADDSLPPEIADYDLNGDGIVSPEELELIQDALKNTPSTSDTSNPSDTPDTTDETGNETSSDSIELDADLNGDGVVTPEELETIRNTMNGVDSEGNPLPEETPVNACQDATNALSWIICSSVQTGGGLVDDLYGAIENILIVKPITTDSSSSIYQVWQKVRDLTNIVFVIFILIVIYSQITGVGINNYGIKRVLPRIIVSAILVNLSFFICALAVDVSNVIGSSIVDFLNKIQNSISTSASTATIIEHINWGAFAGYLTGGAIAFITLTYVGGIKAVFWTVLVALIGVIISVVIGIITIGLRQGVVAILIMIAPLAFVCYLLPNTEKWFEKWKNLLAQMLFFYPMFSFLFGAAKLAGWAIIQGAIVEGSTPGEFTADAFQVIIGLAVQVMPLFLAISLMKMSNTILGKISGGLDRLTSPFRATVGAWGASHAEQNRQRYIRDAHWYNGGRLRAYLQKRQKLRELDTGVNAGHNQDRATEYALKKEASYLRRDSSGHAVWRGRPNAYTRAAKKADLQRLRTGVYQQNLANTLSEYQKLFKDSSSQRLALDSAEAFKDTVKQQFWAENIAQGDQSYLLNEYLKAAKNRTRAPYEFNRLVHDAAGSMGHIGEATIMGQVIKRSAEIESRRRTEAAIMINKFNVSKTAFRGMTFDTAHMNDDGYEEDGQGHVIEDDHYNIKPGYKHQEWQYYLAVDKDGNEITSAEYVSLDEAERKKYRKVRYMDIHDDDGDVVQRVYEDDAGYMKEMLNNDIMIGDPINRRYAMSFGLPRFTEDQTDITAQFTEQLGHLRKYHSTVTSALNNAKYAEHDAAFTAMLTSQINSGYITSASQLNIARLDSIRLTAKTGKIVQNDPIILKEYAKLLNCLNPDATEGERFEDYFTDEAIANYRNVNGMRLHGLRLMTDENGQQYWQKIDRASDDLTLDDQRNFVKHDLIPRTAKKLMGAFKRNLSPTALDNLKPEGVDEIKRMVSFIEQLELRNQDASLPFEERANPRFKKGDGFDRINIFENADPGEIKDRITSAQNYFYSTGAYEERPAQSGNSGEGNYTSGYTGTKDLNQKLQNNETYFNATEQRHRIMEEIDSIFDLGRDNLRRICNDLKRLVDTNTVLRKHSGRAFEIIQRYLDSQTPTNSTQNGRQITDPTFGSDQISNLRSEFTNFVETLPELDT